MATTITIPAGDTGPDIVATLSNANGPQDLTGAAVTLRMRKHPNHQVFPFATTIDAPTTAGVVRKVRSGGDGLVAGTYDVEYHVVFASGAVQTFPTAAPNTIVMRDPIPAA
jgi:hypothetical protein